MKLPYALAGLAALWGMRPAAGRRARPARRAGTGWAPLLVLVPAHLWAGPHVYGQLPRAGRMVSLATPWRLLVDQLDPMFGVPEVRRVVGPVALALMVPVAVLLARAMPAAGRDVAGESARAIDACWPRPGC